MSNPDYPDWNRTEQHNGPPFVYNRLIAPGGPAFAHVGTFPVGQWGGVYVQLDMNNQPATFPVLDFDWYADSALTQLIASDNWTLTNQVSLIDTTPAKGAFLDVGIANLVAASVLHLTLVPVRSPSREMVVFRLPPLLRRFANVGAGAGVNVVATALLTGPAILSVRSTATKWFAEIVTLEPGGLTQSVVATDDLNGQEGNTVHFQLPQFVAQMTLFNKDAAVKQMSGVVMPYR